MRRSSLNTGVAVETTWKDFFEAQTRLVGWNDALGADISGTRGVSSTRGINGTPRMKLNESDESSSITSSGSQHAGEEAWECVGGLDSHVDALKEMVIFPLLYPEFFQKFHLTPPRGVLFYGPPGTGKSLMTQKSLV